MKSLKIGDQVSVIDDTIKGEVVDIVKTKVTIKDENGFLFEFHQNELVSAFNFKESYVDNHNSFIKESLKTVKKNPKKQKKETILEVDLHIHKIANSNKNMNNYDMLSKQLNFAKQKLNFAIKNNITKVVFIHGVGQGVLKGELYQLLKNYKVEINDANYQKYGFGATEIYIFRT